MGDRPSFVASESPTSGSCVPSGHRVDAPPRGGVRLVRSDDAEALAALLTANREFLRPWTPVRDDSYFTARGQRALLEEALDTHRQGTGLPCVITDERDDLIGQILLTDIHRGPVQAGSVGYWVSQEHNSRGVARRALDLIVGEAFGALDLHRLTAATLLANHASQRVLEATRFTRIGVAESAYKINGSWQDHLLYQLVRPGPN